MGYHESTSVNSKDRPFSVRHQNIAVNNSFIPARGLANGHLQTILGNLRRRTFSILRTPSEPLEFLTEPDVRIRCLAHWQRGAAGTVILIHGLEGSAEGSYMLGTASKAWEAGFHVIRMNVRNCGDTEHLTPYLYHSGLTSDLRFVVEYLIKQGDRSPLVLIGFSMGGNQVLKLAGEWGDEAPREIAGVCAVSPPIDLAACSRSIARRRNWIYEYRFLRSLKRKMRRKEALYPARYSTSNVNLVRSIWDFDELTAPLNGFGSAQDYYSRASAQAVLHRIRVPSLIIHARNDPFIPFEPFEKIQALENPWISLLATQSGGHVAFCGRRQEHEDRAWAENRCIEFARNVREQYASSLKVADEPLLTSPDRF